MDDIVREFLQESVENLDRLDQEFVRLESDPTNTDLLGSIFRTIHTIKGSCGFLGFAKLEKIAHAGENLLSQLRARELTLNEEMADALLKMSDAIRAILKEIHETEGEGSAEYLDLVQRLKELQTPAGAGAPKAAAPAETPVEPPPSPPPASVQPAEPANKADEPATAKPPEAEPSGSKNKKGSGEKSTPVPVMGRIGGALVRRGLVRPEEIVHALRLQDEGDIRKLGEILVQLGLVTERDIVEALADKKQPEAIEPTIRVDVNLLEKQMNLVSELVLLRNRLLQIAADTNERNLNSAIHGLNSVTSELRKNVMKTRMQPVSQLFDKLPRIVRDVSKELGKKVNLQTQGGETELDKTLLEAIKDPVTHILRNSLDHGIEFPDKRRAGGKPEEGTVRIRAFHEGGNFQLQISDDGAGIDAERVKQKALSKGLITRPQTEKMTESDILNLIFLPGLSTAEKVTNVSGRGVGMDVVKTNIERIGGKAKLTSVRNQGTNLWLEIPLTLATIPALTVTCGRSVFAIPQAALVEMIAVDADDSQKHIENIDGVSVFRFRGTVIPLLSLSEELKLNSEQSKFASILKLVVVRTENRQFAILVDTIRNTEEIVIKPLDKRFKTLMLYSGAAVLGDGRVALILDIPAFARRAGVVAGRELRTDTATGARKRERVSLLLLGGSDGERMAVPLDTVQRLEEFDRSAKETSCGLDVIQYRNEILRLVRLEDLLEERRAHKRSQETNQSAAPTEKIFGIVLRSDTSKNVVFQVNQVYGIAGTELEELKPPSRAGVRGSIVIQEKITELLDVEMLLSIMRKNDAAAGVLVEVGSEGNHDS